MCSLSVKEHNNTTNKTVTEHDKTVNKRVKEYNKTVDLRESGEEARGEGC